MTLKPGSYAKTVASVSRLFDFMRLIYIFLKTLICDLIMAIRNHAFQPQNNFHECQNSHDV